uniref:Cytochrome P450 monooxygenase TwmD n=1 Tax=Talaromyces wortmannii TaxID=28567 RepID=TWMD_TALWO|nr:RecName: Full=Cytochrome P450 monooxygenase TwmD; AltName: Full=Wortmanamides biosynthesis cluster protein D [Talaromyces wortmannii]AUY61972.1 TwnD [Talaromyces wortmannii]QBC19712.1 TwmD [Talaromyces wortmannii]
MAFLDYPPFDICTIQQLLTFIIISYTFYLTTRSIWRLYFHPLSKYPGPKVAAISDIWYAYHALAGRWPWAVADALEKYGDVVRIAPNEIAFVTPKALSDIYGSHNKNLENFAKTQINNHGNDEHGGLIWEWDPARHREVARQLSPAFSGRALRAKEATLHKYIDLFVERMTTLGGETGGVSLPTWINWLCVDISADMAYNREMNALKDMKEPPYLSILSGFNRAVVVTQMSWRFPLLSPLKGLFLAITAMRSHSHIRNHSRFQLEQRIRRKGAVEHLDFFEQLIPENREPPKDRKEMRHLEQVAGQLLVAGYEPPALWFYFTIYYLLKNPATLDTLTKEIRSAFKNYDEITSGSAAQLAYLSACLSESLRIMPGVLTGMPVVSPGAMVDGTYIPKGVVCQSSSLALARSPRNFRHALSFRPERWLQEDHALYDAQFAQDNRKGFQPFSQGPRICAGKEIAWWQSRVFLAKVLWTFDLEMVSGQQIDMARDLRGWGMYDKPEIRVRFRPKFVV